MDAKTALRILIGQRPTYFHGQLLLADDFLDEQSYHVDARKRHNLYFHDWGVVRGLEITRAADKSIRISPGLAVDASGHEIVLDESSIVSVDEFGPNERIAVGLHHEEEPSEERAAENRRVNCYAAVKLVRAAEASAELVLATVTLGDEAKVGDEAIDYSDTKYARLAAGSVAAEQLHDDLRRGWLRLPFRPDPLVNVPQGEKEMPPGFRVGATEALSPAPDAANEEDKGAAGTMAVPIPPSVVSVTRFRIAGRRNEGEIHLQLIKGGWDSTARDHVRQVLLDEKIASGASFEETFPISEASIDAAYNTLTLWLRGTRRTSVSLVAVEFGY